MPRKRRAADIVRRIPGETLMLAPSGGAYRGDAQYGAVGLFVVAEHVEDLLRSCSRAERIIFGFDLGRIATSRSC